MQPQRLETTDKTKPMNQDHEKYNAFTKELEEALEEYSQTYLVEEEHLQEIEAGIKMLPDEVVSYHHDFDLASKLTDTDIAFVLVGLAFREVVSCLLKSFKIDRLNDQESAKFLHGVEKSNRTQKYYASVDEIISNPVPYDAICSTDPEIKKEVKLSGFGHRFNTLGHDPILGFIFGTANIMTNTITVTDGISSFIPSISTYHVGTYDKDKIYDRADTIEMFLSIYERIKKDPKEGFLAFGVALEKELIHLLSDVKTAKSLPIPFIGVVSPKISRRMQYYLGLDSLVVAGNLAEFYISQLIDKGVLIARDFWWRNIEQEEADEKSLEARWKLIEIYINEGAIVGETAYMVVELLKGDVKKAFQGCSFGTILYSLQKIISNQQLIASLRGEYVINRSEKFIQNL